MKLASRALLATVALGLTAGCGANISGYGDMKVTYNFSGVESPDKVSVSLLDLPDAKCSDLEYHPEENLVTDRRRNLPVEGAVDFTELTDEHTWIVWAVGTRSNGVRVAETCEENIRIRDGQLTEVDLTLENVPLDADGSFHSDVELDLEPPAQMLNLLVVFDLACEGFDINEDACAISNGVANILSDLDVKVRWDFDQRYDNIRGEMIWEEVEGVEVGPEWKLVSGSFNAEVPGATGMVMTTNDLKIHMDQVVLFVIQEVQGYDLADFEDQVDLVLESYVNEMEVTDGSATIFDDNFDGEADVVMGEMNAEITFPQQDIVHPVNFDWYSLRD